MHVLKANRYLYYLVLYLIINLEEKQMCRALGREQWSSCLTRPVVGSCVCRGTATRSRSVKPGPAPGPGAAEIMRTS